MVDCHTKEHGRNVWASLVDRATMRMEHPCSKQSFPLWPSMSVASEPLLDGGKSSTTYSFDRSGLQLEESASLASKIAQPGRPNSLKAPHSQAADHTRRSWDDCTWFLGTIAAHGSRRKHHYNCKRKLVAIESGDVRDERKDKCGFQGCLGSFVVHRLAVACDRSGLHNCGGGQHSHLVYTGNLSQVGSTAYRFDLRLMLTAAVLPSCFRSTNQVANREEELALCWHRLDSYAVDEHQCFCLLDSSAAVFE